MQSLNTFSRGPRILIVGCGDVGRRLAQRLVPRFQVSGTVRDEDIAIALRALGVRPVLLDLDAPPGLTLTQPWVVHLVPPAPHGPSDLRSRRLLSCLSGVERLIYISTSGVYGDQGGGWIDETAYTDPLTERGKRRADAESWLRRQAARRAISLSILRVPGIYARERLPIERLQRKTPALLARDDVYTNHIHADDLAAIIEAALLHGRANRVYHASDDEPMLMGDYFDRVADTTSSPRPQRLPRSQLDAVLSPVQLSFMTESRRLKNLRIKQELGVRLQHPTVESFLGKADQFVTIGGKPPSGGTS